jgi:type IV secretion system protein VirB4
LFELGLGEVALAFTAASSKSDQTAIEKLLAEHGREGFAAGWLRHNALDWAADLLAPSHDQPDQPIGSGLEAAP